MADLFQGLDQQPDLFQGLEEAPAPTARADINRTARMAALGDVDVMEAASGRKIEELTQTYSQMIETTGEDVIRTRAATNQNRLRLNDLAKIAGPSGDPSLVDSARAAAAAVINDDIERRKEAALEKQTVQRIQDMALTDPVQAKMMLNTMELGTADDRITDINVKSMILQREIERAGIAKEAQPWFRDVTDFVAGMIPFNYSAGEVGNVDIPKTMRNWYDNIFAGGRRRAEASSLWNMDAEDFARYIRDHVIPAVNENSTLFGYHDRTEELNILTGLKDTPSVLETNTWNALDNFGGLPFTRLGKGFTSLPGMMVRNGARKQAAEALTRAFDVAAKEGAEAVAEKTGITAEEAIDASLPSAVNPTPTTSIPLGSEIVSAMDRTQELLKRLPEQLPTDRFASEEELNAAIEKVKGQISDNFGRPLVDVKVNEVQLANGSKVRDLEIVLGRGDGKAFATEKSAKQYLAKLSQQGEVIRDESGLFFVKTRVNMPETGWYVQKLNPAQGKVLGLKTDDPIMANIVNARLFGDKLLANQAQRATNALNKNLKAIIEPLTNTINKLNAKEKGRLGALWDRGRSEGGWFDQEMRDMLYERAFGRPMSEREHNAYNAMKDSLDLEWRLRNDDVYMQKHIKGFSTVSFDTGIGEVSRENALVNRLLDKLPNDRIYNVTRGVHHLEGSISPTMLEQLKSEGYILVTTERGIVLHDGTRIKNFLVKGGGLDIEPLRRDQLAYRPGGHTFYKDKYFAKQTVRRRQPDTGASFLDNPNTYINGTKAEVDAWTGRMEAARVEYSRMLDEDGFVDTETLDNILNDINMTGDEFVSNIEKGVFEKDHPFETLYDREMPSEYTGVDAFSGTDAEDSWLRTNGRMYYSPKGEDLPNWLGDKAQVIDPYEAINKSLMNVANLSSFADYKVSAVERWVKTYGGYLDYKSGASDLTVFSEGAWKKGTNQRIINAAGKQRELIKRTIGWRTDKDMANDFRIRSILEWVNGDDPTSFRNEAARNVGNWFNNNNPVAAIRALAFDAKLGLFNAAQLPLQASTMASIFSLSPKYGAHAMGNLIWLRQYLTKSGTDHLLDEYVKRGIHTISGFSDPAEFKAFMKASKQSGFLDIGGTHGMVNQWGPDAALSNLGDSVQTLREQMRFFFNEGELWNRSVAMHVAWKETREMFPNLSTKSADFIRRWEGRAEEYGMNMSRESQAWWQRGIMSIPTQFWAYQARMLEAMLGNTFTPAQRLRLAIGQTVMYGSAGLPLAGLVSSEIAKHRGEAPAIDTFWGSVDRGMIDTFMYNVTGADTTFGKRYASGNWIADTVKEIMGFSSYGDKKSVLDMASGATGSTVFRAFGDGWNIMDKLIKYSVAENAGDIGEPVSKDDWIRLASNISSFSAAHKAWLVSQQGTIESTKGQTLYRDLPTNAAWEIMLFGAEPGKQYDLSAKINYLKDRKKQVDDASKVIENYRIRMLNDTDKIDEYSREMAAYTSLLPADIRAEAVRSAHKKIDPSLYEGVARQVEKKQAEQQMIENMQ